MENIVMEVKDGLLTIEVDLNHTGGESKSGKTLRVASTLGNVDVPTTDGQIKIGLNIYKYKD